MRRTISVVFVIFVMLWASAAVFGAQGLPEQAVPKSLGVCLDGSGQSAADIAKISETGFRFIKTHVKWSEVETSKGKYDFSACDALLASLEPSGVRPVFVLDSANKLYESGRPPHTLEGRTAFSEFAGAAAARYKGKGVIWEIWNEPNDSRNWSPKPSAEDYTDLVASTSAAIKLADPAAAVIGPAVSGVDFAFLKRCLDLGILRSVDAVSVHPYRKGAPESAIDDYSRLEDFIASYARKGKSVPIISSEWGYGGADMPADRQADYVLRSVLTNVMSGITLSILNGRQDTMSLRTLSRELDGCKFVRRLGERTDEYILLFKGPAGYRVAAWTTGDPRATSVSTDSTKASARVVSSTGDMKETVPLRGRLPVRLSQSPVFIEIGKSERLEVEEAIGLSSDYDPKDGGRDRVRVTISNPLHRQISGDASLTIAGRTGTIKHGFKLDPGKETTFQVAPRIDWDGRSAVTAEVSANIQGFTSPIVRQIDLGTSQRVYAEPAAPLDRLMEFRIYNPTGDRLKGKLRLTYTKGINPQSTYARFDAQSQAVVGFTLKDKPQKKFTLAYEVENAIGKTVFRSAMLDYTVVETFEDSPSEVCPLGYEFGPDSGNPGDGSSQAACTEQETDYTAVARIPVCRLRYENTSGNRVFKLVPPKGMAIPEKAVRVGMWLKGDGTGNMLRCRFVDSLGQTFQPNGFPVDFSSWRYKTLPLDGEGGTYWGGAGTGKLKQPISWESLLLIDPAGASTHGTIHLGPVMIVSESTDEPQPAKSVREQEQSERF